MFISVFVAAAISEILLKKRVVKNPLQTLLPKFHFFILATQDEHFFSFKKLP
jgi:hypothetical protein